VTASHQSLLTKVIFCHKAQLRKKVLPSDSPKPILEDVEKRVEDQRPSESKNSKRRGCSAGGKRQWRINALLGKNDVR